MQLRAARPGDALAVAGVHVRAWQAGYRGLLPDAYLEGLRAEDRARRYTFDVTDPERPQTIVAELDGTILGFATTMPADLPGAGEIAALHVDPVAWRRGIGRALIAACRERLAESGFATAILWVMVGNDRAQQFYVADGWSVDGAPRTAEVWGTRVDELRYRRALP
jgi:ribosomal protein S18 acetylase RimI-like enzyme